METGMGQMRWSTFIKQNSMLSTASSGDAGMHRKSHGDIEAHHSENIIE